MVEKKMIFIPNNTPSLKNSKVKTSRGIFSSPTVTKYLRKLGIQSYSSSKKTVKGYVNRPNEFELLRNQFENAIGDKDFPILICFHFVRDSKRAFDFGNATELIFDLLTAHNVIPDDNVKYVFPSVMSIDGVLPTEENMRETDWYSVNKENTGVWLRIV